MTAATITNAQSALAVRFNQTAETVKNNVAEMKADAMELRSVAVTEAKAQASRAVISLSMVLPLVILLVAFLACTSFGLGAFARLLPMGGLMMAIFFAMNVLNVGNSQQ